MNYNMTAFRWFSKIFASLCFETKEALILLEGLIIENFIETGETRYLQKDNTYDSQR